MNFGKAWNNQASILRLTVDVKHLSIWAAATGCLCKSDSAISHVTAMQYVSEVLSIQEHGVLPVVGHQRQLGDSSIKSFGSGFHSGVMTSGMLAASRLALHFICESGSRHLPRSAGSAGLHHAQKAGAVEVLVAEPENQQKHNRKAAAKPTSQRLVTKT